MSNRPLRVLHVVNKMDVGGVEVWLVELLRRFDKRKVHMDFLCHSGERARFDDEILESGSAIYRIPVTNGPVAYYRDLRRLLRESGPYDIVHSHVHYYSGWVLRCAAASGVSTRIAHSHSNRARIESKNLSRRVYIRSMRSLLRRYATHVLAASVEAAESLVGARWTNDDKVQVLHCGINLDHFLEPVDRSAVRAELGIPGDSIVFGHVGRFDNSKNHSFLVRIAEAIVSREPTARFLFVGDGSLREAAEQAVGDAGLKSYVIFTGTRNDVVRLLLGGMDVFIFPSVHEGLGLALVEAQAAGLPCVVSEAIPQEAIVVRNLVHRLSLSDSPSRWADVALEAVTYKSVSRFDALRAVRASTFNICSSVELLERVYLSAEARKPC